MNEIGLHVFAGCLYASSEQAANLKKSARYPERMHVLQLNVIDEQQVDEAFRQIEQTLQQKKIVLHALINNAGVGKSAPVEYGNFETTFGDMLNINLNAPIKMTRAALPLIRKSRQYRPELSGDSRIINICSQAGVFHLSPLAGYSCSKAALIAFTNCLRQEIDQFHIRAISIEPTFFNTPIVSKESGRLNAPLVLESTPAEVLETYPPSFSQLRLQPVESKIVSDKVHLVIDTIVEAAIAYQPEMRYTVAEPLSKMFLVFGSFLPVEVIYILSKMGFQLFSFLSSFDSENSYKVKIHQMHISGITSKSD